MRFLGSVAHKRLCLHVYEQRRVGGSLLRSSVSAYLLLGLQECLAFLAFAWVPVAGNLNASPTNCVANHVLIEPSPKPEFHFCFDELLFFLINLCFVNLPQGAF